MKEVKKVIFDMFISIIFSELIDFVLDIFNDDTINIENKNNFE